MRGLKLCALGCLAAAVLTGCGALPGMEHTDTQEAQVGDVVSTAWFDYTVTRAEAADAYEGRTAPEGSRLVVVELKSIEGKLRYEHKMQILSYMHLLNTPVGLIINFGATDDQRIHRVLLRNANRD